MVPRYSLNITYDYSTIIRSFLWITFFSLPACPLNRSRRLKRSDLQQINNASDGSDGDDVLQDCDRWLCVALIIAVTVTGHEIARPAAVAGLAGPPSRFSKTATPDSLGIILWPLF